MCADTLAAQEASHLPIPHAWLRFLGHTHHRSIRTCCPMLPPSLHAQWPPFLPSCTVRATPRPDTCAHCEFRPGAHSFTHPQQKGVRLSLRFTLCRLLLAPQVFVLPCPLISSECLLTRLVHAPEKATWKALRKSYEWNLKHMWTPNRRYEKQSDPLKIILLEKRWCRLSSITTNRRAKRLNLLN